MMLALSERFGRWLSGLALFGCLLLLAMMLIIVADVALRNLAVPGMPVGSPGMDGAIYQGRKDPFKVLLIAKDGSSTVFHAYP